MIGIKIQNLVWEKALLSLLGDKSEKYQRDHTYKIVITEPTENLQNNCATLILGQDITIPFSFETLQNQINQAQEPTFENKDFKWQSRTRQLLHKKSQQIIQLTEKESEIIAFLAEQPNYQASRETILQAVWHYQSNVHTHTLESHIYALRQKLAPNDDKLITLQNGVCSLIS